MTHDVRDVRRACSSSAHVAYPAIWLPLSLTYLVTWLGLPGTVTALLAPAGLTYLRRLRRRSSLTRRLLMPRSFRRRKLRAHCRFPRIQLPRGISFSETISAQVGMLPLPLIGFRVLLAQCPTSSYRTVCTVRSVARYLLPCWPRQAPARLCATPIRSQRRDRLGDTKRADADDARVLLLRRIRGRACVGRGVAPQAAHPKVSASATN